MQHGRVPPKDLFPRLRRERVSTTSKQWGRALPSVLRLLADRRADVALPTPPMLRAGDDQGERFARALAYWTALDHLLRYQMGWTHPAQGLARWLDQGVDDLCDALALVRHVWLGDGFIKRYMSWRVQTGNDHLPSAWTRSIDRIENEPGREGEPIGPWGLHLHELGMHALSPQDGAAPKLVWLHAFDPADSRGPAGPPLLGPAEPVLLFRGSLESGWYGALQHAPTHEVRVVSEEYGLCGRFRRSPASGRWHTAPEEVHLWGVRPGSDGSLF